MFFLHLALLTLCASAAFHHVERDIEPAEEDLMTITVDLTGIDAALHAFSAKNVTAAQQIDEQFATVTAFTLNASFHVLSCVSLNAAAPDDANEFIQMAEAGYVPQILDVLNRTIAARAAFAATDDFVPVILRDLVAYNASNSEYLANLTDAAPREWLPTAINITRNISTAFSEAIEAYTACSASCPSAKRRKRAPGQFEL
ncbi:hypothetical protein FB451DRAFT_1267469 [Mycena latifolia]|nr:hypothetical protein FB451DRAFT_1267469 [Mycena latifolia]